MRIIPARSIPSELTFRLPTGHGGGSKKGERPKPPKDARETLFSNQVGRVLDVFCVGPIKGFVGGFANSLFLDGIPASQFPGLHYDVRLGEPDQEPIYYYPLVEYPLTVNQIMSTRSAPPSLSFTDPDVDTLILSFVIPQLFKQNKTTGDTTAGYVSLGWKIYYDGSPNASINQSTYRSGVTRNGYGFSVRVPIETGHSSVRIEAYRISPDPTTQFEFAALQWQAVTLQKSMLLRYPEVAYGFLQVQADLFDRIPGRAHLLDGLLLRVPSNYDPDTVDTLGLGAYNGDWNGLFQPTRRYSNNPAWGIYEIVTNRSWGVGQQVDEELLDRYSLYRIARYCDELVPSGRKDAFGADVLERRFTMNAYFQTQEEAYKIISDSASVFGGAAFWAGGRVLFTQDRPRESVVASFTTSNVVDGQFRYTGSARRARHTVALVRWNDPDADYQPAVEYVEDEEGLALYGYNALDLTALGCTSRGQAQRTGRAALLTEKFQQEVINFETGLEAATLLPGQIFRVVDPLRHGARQGGSRITSASTTEVELDQEVTLEAGVYDLAVTYPDATEFFDLVDSTTTVGPLLNHPANRDPVLVTLHVDLDGDGEYELPVEVRDYNATTRMVAIVPPASNGNTVRFRVNYPRGVISRPVSNAEGPTSRITVSVPFDEAPVAGNIWILAKQNDTASLWEVLTVKENSTTRFEVMGVQYAPEKYQKIVENLRFDDLADTAGIRPPSDLTIEAPTNLRVVPEWRQNADGQRTVLYVEWDHPNPQKARSYHARFRFNLGPWSTFEEVGIRSFSVFDAPPGHYDFEVVAENFFYQRSGTLSGSYDLDAMNRAASVSVTGLTVVGGTSRTEFATPDCMVSWGLNGGWVLPVGATIQTGYDYPDGDSLEVPAWFLDYEVRIYDRDDPDTATPIRTHRTRGNSFTYTNAMNAQDHGGTPEDVFIVGVVLRDQYGNESREARLRVQNPPPARPLGLQFDGLFQGVYINLTRPSDADFDGIKVWASLNSGFTPGPENEVYDGATRPIFLPNLLSGATYYIRVAVYDTFSKDASRLNLSDEYAVETRYINAEFDVQKFSIKEAQLGDAVIGKATMKKLIADEGVIADLAVGTLKLAGRAVTSFTEAVMPDPKTVFDYASPNPGVWVPVWRVALNCVDGPVLVTGVIFTEIWALYPSVVPTWTNDNHTQMTSFAYGQVTPSLRYRIVRDPDGPDLDDDGFPGTTVFRSGKVSASLPGYFLSGVVSRFDQPPPGWHTYEIQLLHESERYDAGVVQYVGDGNNNTVWLEGTGNRLAPWLKDFTGDGSVNNYAFFYRRSDGVWSGALGVKGVTSVPNRVRVEFDGIIGRGPDPFRKMAYYIIPWNAGAAAPTTRTQIGLDVVECELQAGQFKR